MSLFGGPARCEAPQALATYRHLLSPQAMTVFNPLRVIAHCDIDAAYAQFESVRLGLPDDIPLICAQWQSIIAVNYPARVFGIKRFTTIDEAKKMCPHLYVQHVATYRNGESEAGYWGEVDPKTHKVSLDPYRRESLKILAIFKEMVPRGEIEKASIDEAFLDVTPMVIERLLERYPYLASIPQDAPDGMDSTLPPAPPVDWTKAGNIFPTTREEESHDDPEHGHDEDGHASQEGERQEKGDRWEDWALCLGAELMAEVRGEVWKQLHYTCSAVSLVVNRMLPKLINEQGIAHNKAMSKLCSAWKKPNNQTVLRASAVGNFLRDMQFTDIRFLGGKLGKAIATEYGATTVGDMLSVPLEELQNRFGEESIWVYNILRGIDHTDVTPRVATKSMLASKNIQPHVTSPEQGYHWLNVLAGELRVRLRDAREISPGLWPKTIVLGYQDARTRQMAFPFTKNLTTEYIVKFARKLWDEATQPMAKGNMRLSNISLTFNGLERLEEGQQGIEGFFGATAARSALIVNQGESTLVDGLSVSTKRLRTPSPDPPVIPKPQPSPKKPRLPTLHTVKRKTALESFLAKNGEPSRPPLPTSGRPPLPASSSSTTIPTSTPITTPEGELGPVKKNTVIDGTLDPAQQENVQETGPEGRWICPRCQTLISAPDEILPSSRAGFVAEHKQEHEDFHFALDLQDGVHDRRNVKAEARPMAKVKKKVKKPEGIKAFFTPKPAK